MNLNRPYFHYLFALIAGALLTLSFAPFHIFPLAILSPAILLGLWLNASPKRAFGLGFTYGLGLFSTGVYWIFISVHTYGNTSPFLATIITGLLIAILALFPALNGYFLNRYFAKNQATKLLCAFPAIWVLLEWVRSWVFTGFPWLLIGYSQMTSLLRGYAPIFSVYGISLVVTLCSGLLVNAVLAFRQMHYKKMYLSLISIAILWGIGTGLSFITWTTPAKEPIKVSLVQGNIAQELKWSPDQVQPTIDRYVGLSEQHWDSNIIIWPESAIPLPFHVAKDFLTVLAQKAIEHKTTFIVGIPMKAPDKEGYYNAVIALGTGKGLYMKQLLVPFGEYIPLRHIVGGLLDLLQVPMSDFIAGPVSPEPITAAGMKIATFICYEIAYPEKVLTRDGNVDMLLTVSNDAWFGHSIAQAQHLEMAQMRALELGRPLLFGSNDGITAVINAKGNVQSRVPQYETVVLTTTVQATKGKTPWQRYGMDPILVILIILLIIAIRKRNKS